MFATLDLIKEQPELARFQFGASSVWVLQRRDFTSRAIALADRFACLDMKPSAPGRLV
jgi:hypothetical protein